MTNHSASQQQTPILAWLDAPCEIINHLHQKHASALGSSNRRSALALGITGPVGSGKSTLAARLAQLTPSVVLSTDDYLPDYETLDPSAYDNPSHADLDLLHNHIEQLALGKRIDKPIWSFQTHSRVGYERLSVHSHQSQVDSTPVAQVPCPLLIVEGIFALHETLGASLDCAIYVDAPPQDRWRRWKQMTLANERGWSIEQAHDFFQQYADPAFHARAPQYRQRACCIVTNPHRNHEGSSHSVDR